MLLPKRPYRIILASDGLWDVLSFTKVARMSRGQPVDVAARMLVNEIVRELALVDDVTVVVIDIVPTDADEGGMNKKALPSTPSIQFGSSLYATNNNLKEEPDSRGLNPESPGYLPLYADVDTLDRYASFLLKADKSGAWSDMSNIQSLDRMVTAGSSKTTNSKNFSDQAKLMNKSLSRSLRISSDSSSFDEEFDDFEGPMQQGKAGTVLSGTARISHEDVSKKPTIRRGVVHSLSFLTPSTSELAIQGKKAAVHDLMGSSGLLLSR